MWDVATGQERWVRDSLYNAAFAPDGKTVAAKSNGELVLLESGSGAVRVSQNIENYPRISTIGESEFIQKVVYTPDGGQLIIACTDGTVRYCDLIARTERTLCRSRRDSYCQSFSPSPDGKWLLTCGDDKTIRVWEVATRVELLRLAVEAGPVTVEFGPNLRTALASSFDSTAILWDLHPRARGRAAPAADLWADLACDDGANVYRAIWELRDDPKLAVALLREKLPLSPSVVKNRVRHLVARLDSDAFAEREEASRELTALGSAALALPKNAQADTASAEVCRRLRDVIERLTPSGPPDCRLARAVQVLELAATPETRQLLRDWSAGAPSVALADDARAALVRLEHADTLRRAGDKP